ncbi:MAG: response regulator transcription factor [Buchananella hordeovulneris]|nr:response regulator transcription factor [Buchananella hordeovulneris]
MTENITVLLADDQSLMRMGFRMVLDAEDGIEVIGEAADGATAIAMVRSLRPDVVLMDVRMPGINGIEATEQIAREFPTTKVLILTTFDLDEYAFAGLRAGASGFLLKDTRPTELAEAIRTVASGEAVVSPRVTRRMLEMFAGQLPGRGASPEEAGEVAASDPGIESLTAREREVLELIAQGMSNAEIADHLVLSSTTIKTHVGNVLAKLEVRDRVQAVVRAYEAGLMHR